MECSFVGMVRSHARGAGCVGTGRRCIAAGCANSLGGLVAGSRERAARRAAELDFKRRAAAMTCAASLLAKECVRAYEEWESGAASEVTRREVDGHFIGGLRLHCYQLTTWRCLCHCRRP